MPSSPDHLDRSIRDLAAKGIPARHIELGNEAYLAMLANPGTADPSSPE